jgi:large repetitive protein
MASEETPNVQSGKKLLVVLAVLTIVGLFVTSLFSLPLVAYGATCTTTCLTVRPSVIAPGNAGTIKGTGFQANFPITVMVDGLATTTSPVIVMSNATGGLGDAGVMFTVPTTAPLGPGGVSASDGTNTATAKFKIATTVLTLTPVKGMVGKGVTISGSGFAFSSSIIVKFGATTVATLTSSNTGIISGSFTVPQMTAGKIKVSASDGTNAATKTFTVVPHLALKPVKGIPGTTVTATGTGFGANSPIAVTFNSITVITGTSSSTGAFILSFTAPNDPLMTYKVTATDSGSNTASANFALN